MPKYIGLERLRTKLAEKRLRVNTRYNYYEMKYKVNTFASIIPEKFKTLSRTLGWCAKAVDTLANRIVFDEFENDDFEINQIFAFNNKDIFIDDSILSSLISACSFVYISAGADGYPRLQTIDGANATGVIDPITKMLNEGYAVIERDTRGMATLEAYFTAGQTTFYRNGKISKTIPNNSPYALLVPIINCPDAKRQFGHSRISRACMDYMQGASITLSRSEVCAEFYSFPQKYVLGMSEQAEFDSRLATISSFLSFTNGVASSVQKTLDKKAGISIKPQQANYPADRVHSIVNSLTDTTATQEVIQRRLDAPVRNVTNSMYDDYVETNAKFRSKAGLECYIIRDDHNGCCEWCRKLAGKYKYPDDVPKNVYQRHDNCTCSVTYVSGKNAQNVWSKKTWQPSENELTAMKSKKVEVTKLTPQEAKAKEDLLKSRGKTVDKVEKSDIIEMKTSNGISISKFSKHMEERAVERGVTLNEVKDALNNPLHIDDIKIDSQQRPSQRFIGKKATVNVNPETGTIATIWKTGKKKVEKY